MQIVIDICKDDFDEICLQARMVEDTRSLFGRIRKSIFHGIRLPKGHGDLIDRNDLLKHYDNTTYHNGIEERKIHFVQIGYVNDAPTIIEADKAESEPQEK